jgi:hypothetical protein
VNYYLHIILGVALVGCSDSPHSGTSLASRIRVQNLTGQDWALVIVSTNDFGAVKNGATTEYQKTWAVPLLEDRAFVQLVKSNGYTWRHRYLDGDSQRMEDGDYTYILKVSPAGSLDIKRRKDP